jgi:hypothetical protein
MASWYGSIFSKLAEIAGRLVQQWRQAVSVEKYRPEKHYMRGTGPKSSAKPGSGGSHPQNDRADGRQCGANPASAPRSKIELQLNGRLS